MALKEKFNIKTTWDCDHNHWEYHVYSSITGFVITCQTLKQALLFVRICEDE